MTQKSETCFTVVKPSLKVFTFISMLAMVLPAAEFTLLETPVNHTSELAGSSPFEPAAGVPSNWNAPDDYMGGTAHFQLEIVDKPSEGSIHYSVCVEQGNTTACADSYHAYLPGFHQWSQPLSQWNNIDQIDWGQSLSIVLSLRDCNGDVIDPDQNDWCGAPFLGLYYPMQANFTAIMVSAGATFSGWENPAAVNPFSGSDKTLQAILQHTGSPTEFQLTVFNQTGSPARVNLLDSRGRSLNTWGQAGPSTVWMINSQSLKSTVLKPAGGIYFLQIRAGRHTESIRLLHKGGV